MMDDVAVFLQRYSRRKIKEGKSGADVWTVGDDMILKYAHRKTGIHAEVWRTYQNEARMYLWFRDHEISLVPDVLYEKITSEEVILLLRRYRALDRGKASLMLPDILRVLAELHSLPIPDFLGKPAQNRLILSQAQIDACLDGWRSVFSEHKGRFCITDIKFVAGCFNMLQKRFTPTELRLVHGDFHCGNLLLDENNMLRVCDWQNAHVDTPAVDLAFFLSRLSADGVFLDTERLIAGYCAAAREMGMSIDAESVRCDITLSSLHTAFVFWYQYLQGSPTERVESIFEKMIHDAHWLWERR